MHVKTQSLYTVLPWPKSSYEGHGKEKLDHVKTQNLSTYFTYFIFMNDFQSQD